VSAPASVIPDTVTVRGPWSFRSAVPTAVPLGATSSDPTTPDSPGVPVIAIARLPS